MSVPRYSTRRPAAVPIRLMAERSMLERAIAAYHDVLALAEGGRCGDLGFDVEIARRRLARISARIAHIRARLH